MPKDIEEFDLPAPVVPSGSLAPRQEPTPPPTMATGTDDHLTPVATSPPTCGPFSGIVHKSGRQRGGHRATGERRAAGEPTDHCGGPTTAELKELG